MNNNIAPLTIRDLVSKFGGVNEFCRAVSAPDAKLTPGNVYKFQMNNEITAPWGYWVKRAIEKNKIEVGGDQLDLLIVSPSTKEKVPA